MTRNLKFSALLFVLSLTAAATSTTVSASTKKVDLECHSKICDFDDGSHVCCLNTPGTITCTPCGQVE